MTVSKYEHVKIEKTACGQCFVAGPLLNSVADGSTFSPGIKSVVMEENTAYCSATSVFGDADTSSLKTYHAGISVYEEIN